jgi:hypothetical protein
MPSSRISRNGSVPVPKKNLSPDERNQQANEELSTRYDTITKLLSEAETKLKRLRPPVSVWLAYGSRPLDPDDPNDPRTQWELVGLTKYEDKVRLCHAYDSDISDISDVRPIVECAAEVRVKAAKMIRKLRLKVIRSKEEFIPQVDEAIKELMEALSEF